MSQSQEEQERRAKRISSRSRVRQSPSKTSQKGVAPDTQPDIVRRVEGRTPESGSRVVQREDVKLRKAKKKGLVEEEEGSLKLSKDLADVEKENLGLLRDLKFNITDKEYEKRKAYVKAKEEGYLEKDLADLSTENLELLVKAGFEGAKEKGMKKKWYEDNLKDKNLVNLSEEKLKTAKEKDLINEDKYEKVEFTKEKIKGKNLTEVSNQDLTKAVDYGIISEEKKQEALEGKEKLRKLDKAEEKGLVTKTDSGDYKVEKNLGEINENNYSLLKEAGFDITEEQYEKAKFYEEKVKGKDLIDLPIGSIEKARDYGLLDLSQEEFEKTKTIKELRNEELLEREDGSYVPEDLWEINSWEKAKKLNELKNVDITKEEWKNAYQRGILEDKGILTEVGDTGEFRLTDYPDNLVREGILEIDKKYKNVSGFDGIFDAEEELEEEGYEKTEVLGNHPNYTVVGYDLEHEAKELQMLGFELFGPNNSRLRGDPIDEEHDYSRAYKIAHGLDPDKDYGRERLNTKELLSEEYAKELEDNEVIEDTKEGYKLEKDLGKISSLQKEKLQTMGFDISEKQYNQARDFQEAINAKLITKKDQSEEYKLNKNLGKMSEQEFEEVHDLGFDISQKEYERRQSIQEAIDNELLSKTKKESGEMEYSLEKDWEEVSSENKELLKDIGIEPVEKETSYGVGPDTPMNRYKTFGEIPEEWKKEQEKESEESLDPYAESMKMSTGLLNPTKIEEGEGEKVEPEFEEVETDAKVPEGMEAVDTGKAQQNMVAGAIGALTGGAIKAGQAAWKTVEPGAEKVSGVLTGAWQDYHEWAEDKPKADWKGDKTTEEIAEDYSRAKIYTEEGKTKYSGDGLFLKEYEDVDWDKIESDKWAGVAGEEAPASIRMQAAFSAPTADIIGATQGKEVPDLLEGTIGWAGKTTGVNVPFIDEERAAQELEYYRKYPETIAPAAIGEVIYDPVGELFGAGLKGAGKISSKVGSEMVGEVSEKAAKEPLSKSLKAMKVPAEKIQSGVGKLAGGTKQALSHPIEYGKATGKSVWNNELYKPVHKMEPVTKTYTMRVSPDVVNDPAQVVKSIADAGDGSVKENVENAIKVVEDLDKTYASPEAEKSILDIQVKTYKKAGTEYKPAKFLGEGGNIKGEIKAQDVLTDYKSPVEMEKISADAEKGQFMGETVKRNAIPGEVKHGYHGGYKSWYSGIEKTPDIEKIPSESIQKAKIGLAGEQPGKTGWWTTSELSGAKTGERESVERIFGKPTDALKAKPSPDAREAGENLQKILDMESQYKYQPGSKVEKYYDIGKETVGTGKVTGEEVPVKGFDFGKTTKTPWLSETGTTKFSTNKFYKTKTPVKQPSLGGMKGYKDVSVKGVGDQDTIPREAIERAKAGVKGEDVGKTGWWAQSEFKPNEYMNIVGRARGVGGDLGTGYSKREVKELSKPIADLSQKVAEYKKPIKTDTFEQAYTIAKQGEVTGKDTVIGSKGNVKEVIEGSVKGARKDLRGGLDEVTGQRLDLMRAGFRKIPEEGGKPVDVKVDYASGEVEDIFKGDIDKALKNWEDAVKKGGDDDMDQFQKQIKNMLEESQERTQKEVTEETEEKITKETSEGTEVSGEGIEAIGKEGTGEGATKTTVQEEIPEAPKMTEFNYMKPQTKDSVEAILNAKKSVDNFISKNFDEAAALVTGKTIGRVGEKSIADGESKRGQQREYDLDIKGYGSTETDTDIEGGLDIKGDREVAKKFVPNLSRRLKRDQGVRVIPDLGPGLGTSTDEDFSLDRGLGFRTELGKDIGSITRLRRDLRIGTGEKLEAGAKLGVERDTKLGTRQATKLESPRAPTLGMSKAGSPMIEPPEFEKPTKTISPFGLGYTEWKNPVANPFKVVKGTVGMQSPVKKTVKNPMPSNKRDLPLANPKKKTQKFARNDMLKKRDMKNDLGSKFSKGMSVDIGSAWERTRQFTSPMKKKDIPNPFPTSHSFGPAGKTKLKKMERELGNKKGGRLYDPLK